MTLRPKSQHVLTLVLVFNVFVDTFMNTPGTGLCTVRPISSAMRRSAPTAPPLAPRTEALLQAWCTKTAAENKQGESHCCCHKSHLGPLLHSGFVMYAGTRSSSSTQSFCGFSGHKERKKEEIMVPACLSCSIKTHRLTQVHLILYSF